MNAGGGWRALEALALRARLREFGALGWGCTAAVLACRCRCFDGLATDPFVSWLFALCCSPLV